MTKKSTKKKVEKCACGCGADLINPFSEDDLPVGVEPYEYDYE